MAITFANIMLAAKAAMLVGAVIASLYAGKRILTQDQSNPLPKELDHSFKFTAGIFWAIFITLQTMYPS